MKKSKLPVEWINYIKFTDIILNDNCSNEYTVSNPFLHPTKPTYSRLRIIKELNNKNISSLCKIKFKFYFYLIRSFLDVLKQFFISRKYISKNTSRFIEKKYDLIFVSHLNSTDRLETEVDSYYGNLINELSKTKKILLILIPHFKYSKKKVDIFLKKSRKYDIYIFSNELVNIEKKIACIKSVLRERRKFILLSKKNNGLKKNLLFFTGNSFLSPGNYSNLMNAIQLKTILNPSNKKIIITTFEGFAWERLFFFHGHNSGNKFKCIGYQHTLIFKYQHSLTRCLNKKYNPDLILCSGVISADTLRNKMKNKNISIKVIGSPKGLKKNKYKVFPKKDHILFIPSGDIQEAKYMINFANQFANKNKHISTFIRFHPILANSIKSLVKIKSNNLNISSSNLKEDCISSKWIVYISSTAVYEGICLNCIPIRLSSFLASDLSDPLWQIESRLIKKVSTTNQLTRFLKKSSKNNQYINSNLMKELFNQVYKLRSNLNLEEIKKQINI